MPIAHTRKMSEVPPPSRTSRKSRVKQSEYNGFVNLLKDDDVGELELAPEENLRGVKVSLRNAGTRLGIPLDVWDANGKVYYRRGTGTKRGRSRSMLDIARNSMPTETEAEGIIDLSGGS